jgi:hypothetical protein
MAAAHLQDALRRGARRSVLPGPARLVFASPPTAARHHRVLPGLLGVPPLALGCGTSATVSSHAPDQLLSFSSMSSLAALATCSGNSIMATWPASGMASTRESRKANDALRAIRKETSRSRPP